MKILYNPPNGQPIGENYNGWIFEGNLLEDHVPGELKQYPDPLADAIKEAFQFFQELTADEAKKILENPNKFKCDRCDFSTNTNIALLGHMKKHEKEDKIKELIPAIDPSLIPVAGGTTVIPNKSANSNSLSPEEVATRDGVDKDNVEWYGGGVKETRRDFQPMKPYNKGHFGRQPIRDDDN
jgi:hypothetical protein